MMMIEVNAWVLGGIVLGTATVAGMIGLLFGTMFRVSGDADDLAAGAFDAAVNGVDIDV